MGLIISLPFFILAAIELHGLILLVEASLKPKQPYTAPEIKPTPIVIPETETETKKYERMPTGSDPFEWDIIIKTS